MDAIFNAGFYSQYLWMNRNKIEKALGFSLEDRLRRLSAFSIKQISQSNPQIIIEEGLQKALSVYINIISRGLPTLAPITIEQNILNFLKPYISIDKKEVNGTIQFLLDNRQHTKKLEEEWFASLAKAHFPIDPRVKVDANIDFDYGSAAEKEFHAVYLPKFAGEMLPLLLQSQRGFESLLHNAKSINFVSQRCDLSLDVGKTKLIFEIDGHQHDANVHDIHHDRSRDSALSAAGWKVYRIPTECIRANGDPSWDGLEALNDEIRLSPELSIYNQNYSSPFWVNKVDVRALYAVLAPYAVARIQRTLLLALQNGNLRFSDDVWSIVLIERDLRCASLAVLDFVNALGKIFELMGLDVCFPTIELNCFYTEEFADNAIVTAQEESEKFGIHCSNYPIEKFQGLAIPAQIIIDHSILSFQGYQIPGENYYDQSIRSDGAIFLLRNSHFFAENRIVESTWPISYAVNGSNFEDSLLYFLQNIFRKAEFRPNQIEVLSRSLALKPVIGLLPTGAGKSICYQLSALLQPGVSIVIDPLTSLMIDQVENLRVNYAIDWIGYINSGQSAEEREKAIQHMVDGQYLIMFISPERLQSKEFRRKLGDMCVTYSVPYAVIDEAHCVSEWGHDFRTSYLNLSAVIRHWCLYKKDADCYIPTLIALTGTASYSVLSDVQREIGINDEAAKISPKSFDRGELKFDAVSVPSNQKFDRLKLLLKNMPKYFNRPESFFFQSSGTEADTYSGIVFVPHINGEFGAYEVSKAIGSIYPSQVRYFCGQPPKDSRNGGVKKSVMTEQEFQKYKTETQKAFTSNQFCLLVSTKAFGMGIDKPNIRYVIHYNIPDSLEAYYQEAGRSGRDGNEAYCVLIYSEANQDSYGDNAKFVRQVENYQRTNNKGGDIDRLMFLHKLSFPSQEEEFENAVTLLRKYIYPTLEQSQFDEKWKVLIPFDEHRKESQEKAIYRLMTIGLIGDYTLDYRRSFFEVRFIRRQDENYIECLQKYIQRYRTIELSGMIRDAVYAGSGENVIEKCLSYLLGFVYKEIEQKRCAAIESMAEVARRASMLPTQTERDKFVRQELLAYLDHSPFTEDLKVIATEFVPERWRDILKKKDDAGKYLLHNVDGARQLVGGCRRALESHPGYPGLLCISVLGRLLLPDQEASTIRSEFLGAVKALETVPDDLCELALNTVLDFYEEWLSKTPDYQSWYQWFATAILQRHPFRSIARRCIDVLPERCAQILANMALDNLKKLNQTIFGYQREVTYEQYG